MIQIIAGTFGYYNGRKVIPITNADGPIELDPALERRLVEKKVAVYVTPARDLELQGETEATADGLPAYNADMKLAELQDIASAYGVDASAMRKKADVIAAIEAAKVEEEADEGEELDDDLDDDPDDEEIEDDPEGSDDEPPPALGATDPV